MSTHINFYGDTPQDAEQKARAYAAKLDMMRQATVSPARLAPATMTFNPDGTQEMSYPKGKYIATVQYYGLD